MAEIHSELKYLALFSKNLLPQAVSLTMVPSYTGTKPRHYYHKIILDSVFAMRTYLQVVWDRAEGNLDNVNMSSAREG